MASETKLFPNARFVPEGAFAASNHAVVFTSFVDLGGSALGPDVPIVKLGKPEHAIETADNILISRPHEFRNKGEVLLQDPQEGRVSRSSSTTVDTTDERRAAFLQRRVDALNAAAKLNESIMNFSASAATRKSQSDESFITFGSEWLLYCTAIYDPDYGEAEWKRDFSDRYTHASIINRPTQFAEALGSSVCENVGTFGKPTPVSFSLSKFVSAETERGAVFVVHGPTLYVDDPYEYVSQAEPGWEMICAMIFLKSHEHAKEREYRFAILPVAPSTDSKVFLPVTGAMRDCLSPLAPPIETSDPPEPTVIPEEGTTEIKLSSPTRTHTCRRRVTRSRKTSSNEVAKETQVGDSDEETIEETIISPDEVKNAFGDEEKKPDIIIFQQYGSSFRCVHYASYSVETECWRVETVRDVGRGGDADTPGSWPGHLSIPSEVAISAGSSPPWSPKLILEYCLDPSHPRAPADSTGDRQYSSEELAHIQACSRSLAAAVEMVPEIERERAAASSWYATAFIAGVVAAFGPIIRSVCIIREGVVVVELMRARFSGAVGWATFSGSGMYSLYIRKGDSEQFKIPGYATRPHPMEPGMYADALHKNGWHRKN